MPKRERSEAPSRNSSGPNPHSLILMTVDNDKGQAEQWAIEMGADPRRLGAVPKPFHLA
jgi:hypothetical protein